MTKLEEFKRHLRPGQVYRREDLTPWSNAVDRHLKQLVDDGTLTKLAPGLYLNPKETVFGKAPAADDKLVETFLKDRRFLLASPNAYNMLGVGTTQLYDRTVVYNHKRHGEFRLGGRTFDFRVRPSFPKTLSPEFLLVDLVNNVDRLAESKREVLQRVRERAASFDGARLQRAARDYGKVSTKNSSPPCRQTWRRMADYLHDHPQFADLIRIVAAEKGIDPALVEKDYWIMHCLFGLQRLGLTFQLKGGTSLSKGFQAIDRFSEDIDIRIEPPPDRDVKTGRNQTKPAQVQSRKAFYDWLANTIRIDGVDEVTRDTAFDNKDFFSAGIRLHYRKATEGLEGLREGVLLELGFDDVTPNISKDISSWAYDYGADKVDIIDNRAKGVACYDPRYTFVEKLQTISTKFRLQQKTGESPIAFTRHYYDVYGLLRRPDVQAFIGSEAYKAHKTKRFRGGDNPNIAQNDAFFLSNPATRKMYKEAFAASGALYYGEKPSLDQVLAEIAKWIDRL